MSYFTEQWRSYIGSAIVVEKRFKQDGTQVPVYRITPTSTKRRSRVVVQVFLGIAAVYLLYGVLVYAFQRSLLFPGMGIHVAQTPPAEERIEVVPLQVGDARIEAWFVKADTGLGIRTPTVIFAHGNYETIDTAFEGLLAYTAHGVNLMLVEYPGYGRCTGAPSEEMIADGFAEAYDWLIANEHTTGAAIIGHGRSIGGGAICALSTKRKLDGMILQSTFTSVESFAGRYMMPAFLVRDRFDNIGRVAEFEGPILIYHGLHDELIPFRSAEELHDAAPQSILVSSPCGHNDCPKDEVRYWNTITDFIQTVIAERK